MDLITFNKRLILYIVIVFLPFLVFTQNNTNNDVFLSEFSIFNEELGDFLSKSNNDEIRKNYNNFKKSIDSFSLNHKKKIKSIIYLMYEKRFRPKPHFNKFIETLLSINNLKNNQLLDQWLFTTQNILENHGGKKLLLFCVFSNQLINKKLRSNKAIEWIFESENFSFDYYMNQPVAKFDSIFNLKCITSGSSIMIERTKGMYFPFSSTWEGNDGFVFWDKFGLSKDSVFARMSTYEIDFKKSIILADSCLFYNKYEFNYPINGKLEHKAVSNRQSSKYPKFTSYNMNIEIKNIFPNIDYRGGYRLSGNNFIAYGGEYAEAKIVFKRDGKDIFIANANKFNISSDRIASLNSGVKIFFDSDSLYHSNIEFTYINSERKLKLYVDRSKSSGSPMFNTYHKITMDFELLEWHIDQDVITFGSLPGASQSDVFFESLNMYSESRYYKLQGIDDIHPLIRIKNYIKEKGERKFYVQDFARYAKFSWEVAQPYLITLADQGFLYYDFGEHRVSVLPLFDSYLDAASGIGDYDVISFKSTVNKGQYLTQNQNLLINAALNIKTKDLNVLGIPDIALSTTRGVYLSPYLGKIVIKKNRDFIFNGGIYAGKGRLKLFGSNFSFNYDQFKIDLNSIDSVQLSVPVRPIRLDNYNNEVLTRVKTVIEAVTGELIIDDPTNKSGIRKDSFPQFPIFKSFNDSYAYYDKPNIYNSVYDRKDFYFHLNEFEIDSLDSYTGKGIWFSGEFKSSGIFPDFKDTLRLQRDYSLGFRRSAPDSGFAIYNNKARYFNEIYLSDKGLKGKGRLEYLSASALSKDISFFPDSTNLISDKFYVERVEKGIEFPEVNNTKTNIKYKPYQDILNASKINSLFSCFENRATFDGDFKIQPIGMSGSGIMNLKNCEVESSYFKYNSDWFASDTSNLIAYEKSLFSESDSTIKSVSFIANNLRSYIDLERSEGIFNSNGDDSYVNLPINKYICYIDMLKWDMQNNMLNLSSSIGNVDIQSSKNSGFELVSTSINNDSLRFFTNSAEYNLNKYILSVDGVDDLYIADVVISPDSGKMKIFKGGVIDTLRNAKIVTNNEYHQFNESNINITSANEYHGNGNYVYYDASGTSHNIYLNQIYVTKDTITNAKGELLDSVINLNEKFNFKGGVDLFANKKYLIFDGYLMVMHNSNFIQKEWVKFRSEINPTILTFKLNDKIYNDKEDLLNSSLVMSLDSTNFYTSFLSRKNRGVDNNSFNARGCLNYSYDKNAFVILSEDSLTKYWLFDNENKIEGEGDIDLNLNTGRVETKFTGNFQHDMQTTNTEFRGFLLIDFLFSDKALKIMADDIYSAPSDIMYDYNNNYLNNLSRLVGADRADNLLVDLEIKDEYSSVPDNLNKNFSFTDVKLVWDNKNKAYVSKGNIGLGNILNHQLNVFVDGHIILKKGRNSDELYIYLQTDFYDEYYFHYKNGVNRAWSTNEAFNLEIQKVNDSKRKAEQKRGQSPYRYMIAPDDATEKFIKKIKKRF